MNIRSLLNIIIMLLLPTMAMAQYDSFSIGVNGSNTNHSATFYKNNFLYGLDFARFSMNSNLGIYSVNPSSNSQSSQESTGGLSINIFMPRLGYRMSVKSRGKVNTYNQIEGYLIIPMVQPKGDYETIMNEYENNTGIDIEKEVEDAITLMGLKISHAIEYEFNEQFSLTASVGINWIFWDYNFNMTSQNNNYVYYSNYGYYYNTITETTKLDLSAHLGYTYTMLTLNYNLDYIKPSPEMSQ